MYSFYIAYQFLFYRGYMPYLDPLPQKYLEFSEALRNLHVKYELGGWVLPSIVDEKKANHEVYNLLFFLKIIHFLLSLSESFVPQEKKSHQILTNSQDIHLHRAEHIHSKMFPMRKCVILILIL